MTKGPKPILVLVGGPGGAGKTTLGRVLSERLGFVHLSRDAVKSAIAVTEAVVSPRGTPVFDESKAVMGGEYGQRAFTTAYAAVEALLGGGASVVIDQAWRRGVSEPELAPLVRLSRPLLLIATVAPEVARRRAGARGHRPGLAPLAEAIADADAQRDDVVSFDIGVPRLVVDTTSDYDPSLSDIERWIWTSS